MGSASCSSSIPLGISSRSSFHPLFFTRKMGFLTMTPAFPQARSHSGGFWRAGFGSWAGSLALSREMLMTASMFSCVVAISGGKRREGSRLSVFPPQWKVPSALLLTFLLPMECLWRDFFQEGHFPPACALLGGAPGVSVGSTGQRGASVS